MNRFVRPDEITLPLTQGDTITIRRELTNGERTESFRRAMYYDWDHKEWVRDPLKSGMALVTSYLIDWTFKGEGDRVVPIKGLSLEELTQTLDAIPMEYFVEVLNAIQAHEAQLAREKQRPEAQPPSDPTSTSRVGAAGGMTGSAT
jgi:hypothetical protein